MVIFANPTTEWNLSSKVEIDFKNQKTTTKAYSPRNRCCPWFSLHDAAHKMKKAPRGFTPLREGDRATATNKKRWKWHAGYVESLIFPSFQEALLDLVHLENLLSSSTVAIL